MLTVCSWVCSSSHIPFLFPSPLITAKPTCSRNSNQRLWLWCTLQDTARIAKKIFGMTDSSSESAPCRLLLLDNVGPSFVFPVNMTGMDADPFKGIVTCFKCRLLVCQGWLKGLCLFDSHDTAMVSVRLRIFICWVTFALWLGLFVSSWFIGWVFSIPCKAVAFWIPEVFLQENLLRKLVVTLNLCTASNSYLFGSCCQCSAIFMWTYDENSILSQSPSASFSKRSDRHWLWHLSSISFACWSYFYISGHLLRRYSHFFLGPLSTLCCLCLADKELFVLSQLGTILAISNVGGGIVLKFSAFNLCAS